LVSKIVGEKVEVKEVDELGWQARRSHRLRRFGLACSASIWEELIIVLPTAKITKQYGHPGVGNFYSAVDAQRFYSRYSSHVTSSSIWRFYPSVNGKGFPSGTIGYLSPCCR
jgi:hypothetical protein